MLYNKLSPKLAAERRPFVLLMILLVRKLEGLCGVNLLMGWHQMSAGAAVIWRLDWAAYASCLTHVLVAGSSAKCLLWPLLPCGLKVVELPAWWLLPIEKTVHEHQVEADAFFQPSLRIPMVSFPLHFIVWSSHKPAHNQGEGCRPWLWMMGGVVRSQCKKACGWVILLWPSLENVSHHTWYLQKLIFPDLLLGTLCQIPK